MTGKPKQDLLITGWRLIRTISIGRVGRIHFTQTTELPSVESGLAFSRRPAGRAAVCSAIPSVWRSTATSCKSDPAGQTNGRRTGSPILDPIEDSASGLFGPRRLRRADQREASPCLEHGSYRLWSLWSTAIPAQDYRKNP